MPATKTKVGIRRARGSDAAAIAELSGQLGYPTAVEEMRGRLRDVLKDREGACFVAVAAVGKVTGWIHVSVTPLLEVERRAEVNGLVVDRRMRSLGAGAMLLAAGENWARRMRSRTMSVRSNVQRRRAHGFYLQNGYEHYKTQKAFRKTL